MGKRSRRNRSRRPATTGAAGGLTSGRPEEKVKQAREFLADARAAWPNDWRKYRRNLESALVYARSALDQIPKEYGSVKAVSDAGFAEWFRSNDAKFRVENPDHDPLLAFLKATRDVVIHESTASLVRHTTLSTTVDVLVASELTIRVHRAERSSMRQWLHDRWSESRLAFMNRLNRLRRRFQRAARRPTTVVTRRPVFSHDSFRHETADDLAERFIESVERIAFDARMRFGPLTR